MNSRTVVAIFAATLAACSTKPSRKPPPWRHTRTTFDVGAWAKACGKEWTNEPRLLIWNSREYDAHGSVRTHVSCAASFREDGQLRSLDVKLDAPPDEIARMLPQRLALIADEVPADVAERARTLAAEPAQQLEHEVESVVGPFHVFVVTAPRSEYILPHSAATSLSIEIATWE